MLCLDKRPFATELKHNQLMQEVRNICRVRVNKVEFDPVGTIGEDAPGIVDERAWE